MNIQDQEIKNSSNFYLSKAVTLFTCPQKYFYQYHKWIQPKGEPRAFLFGRIVHKAAENHFLYGIVKAVETIEQSELTSEEKDLALEMYDYFREKIESLSNFDLMAVEKAVSFPLSNYSKFFKDWRVKADFIHHDSEGFWNSDIKTTSTTGPKVAEYYHNSPQTLTYFYVMSKHVKNMTGTKIFVLTKKKVRCEVEPIPFNDSKLWQAEQFILNTLKRADEVEEGILEGYIDKYMTSCDNMFLGSCSYKPLCFNRRGKEQEEFLIKDWFEIRNPDDHLELEKE